MDIKPTNTFNPLYFFLKLLIIMYWQLRLQLISLDQLYRATYLLPAEILKLLHGPNLLKV